MSERAPAWQDLFPALATADQATREAMEGAHLVELPANQPVFFAGAPCQSYLLVLEGKVRVQIIGEGGREAVLYRVLPGQSCVLTTCCTLSGNDYPAEGYTETPVRALLFNKASFDRNLETAPAFRRFVFENLGQRLAEVIVRMEEVAFRPVERRLAAFLLDRAGEGSEVKATHQVIAVELGTAREVVSRYLKRLEDRGLVRLGRSAVEILDRAGLQATARDSL